MWQPENYYLYLICILKDDPKGYDKKVILNETIILYNEKKIKIFSSYYVDLAFIDYKNPFLYSGYQTIDLNDGNEEYDLKFKAGSYYDNLYFYMI